MARLQANGTLDTGFTPPVLDDPYNVMSLVETTDGKAIVGGWLGVNGAYPNLLRLNHDGTLDATFPDLGVDKSVLALAIARDGKILLSGTFLHVAGIARKNLARLSAPQAAQQSLSVDNGTVAWQYTGASAQISQPPRMSYSSDNNTYVPLGTFTRNGSSWQYGGFNAPVAQFYWLRVQAPDASGAFNGSQGIVQYTREFFLSDEIFKDGF